MALADFILQFIGEELGFIGVAELFWHLWRTSVGRLFRLLAMHQFDGRLIAAGCTSMFIWAFVNIGGVLGLCLSLCRLSHTAVQPSYLVSWWLVFFDNVSKSGFQKRLNKAQRFLEHSWKDTADASVWSLMVDGGGRSRHATPRSNGAQIARLSVRSKMTTPLKAVLRRLRKVQNWFGLLHRTSLENNRAHDSWFYKWIAWQNGRNSLLHCCRWNRWYINLAGSSWGALLSAATRLHFTVQPNKLERWYLRQDLRAGTIP